jgi:hypothetical protein
VKNQNKEGLVEWLMVYALSSNPSTSRKKKKEVEQRAWGSSRALAWPM